MKLVYLIVLQEYGVENAEYFTYEINKCAFLDVDEAYTYVHRKNLELKRDGMEDEYEDRNNWVRRTFYVRTLELILHKDEKPVTLP